MKQLAQITGITDPAGSKFKINDYANLPGLVVSRLLAFAIIGAGLLFFIRLISAGYAFMTSGGDSGKTQSAGKEITNAVVGLLIVLTAYFIAQILQVIFGIKIL